MAQSVEFDSGGDGTVLAVPQKQSEPIQVRHPLLSEIFDPPNVRTSVFPKL